MKIAIKSACAVLAVLAFAAILPNSGAAQSEILAFEGKVVAVTPMPSLDVSCGVAAPQLLIKYEIERLYAGAYDEKEIIVDHLACGASGVRAIAQGDDVLVVARAVHHVPEEIDSLGLRSKSPVAKQYFLALSVGKRVFTMR
jgi:hypothetical protein